MFQVRRRRDGRQEILRQVRESAGESMFQVRRRERPRCEILRGLRRGARIAGVASTGSKIRRA